MPSRQKHVPQRTCIICREVKPKRSLIRLVRTPDQGVQIDPTGKRAGRGAYLCDNPACWDRALRGDALARALRTSLSDRDRERIAAHRDTLSSARATSAPAGQPTGKTIAPGDADGQSE
ncbi:MAG: YlxR family protein [Anaerolineae bacterium]